MTTLLLILLAEIVLWLLLAAVRSLRLSPSGVSDYEIRHQVKAGNEQARFMQRRDAALPDVRVLQYICETLLVVGLVAVALATFEWLIAVPLLVIALMYAEGAARWQFIVRRAQVRYETYEPRIIGFAERWQGALKWLRGTQGSVPGQFIYSKAELLERLKTTHGIISKDELMLIQHGLAFGEKLARNVMTPRSVIDGLEAKDTLGPVMLDHLHNSGHSRFPVYEKDIDHIVGMLYLRDLIPLKKNIKYARDAMQPEVYYIRDDHNLEYALAAFLRTHHHLLIVVNEYRETVGLLSLEDVMEALLGRKIIDEFDKHDDLRAVASRNPRANNLPKQGKNV